MESVETESWASSMPAVGEKNPFVKGKHSRVLPGPVTRALALCVFIYNVSAFGSATKWFIVQKKVIEPNNQDCLQLLMHSYRVAALHAEGSRFRPCPCVQVDLGKPPTLRKPWKTADHTELGRPMV